MDEFVGCQILIEREKCLQGWDLNLELIANDAGALLTKLTSNTTLFYAYEKENIKHAKVQKITNSTARI